MRKLRNKNQPRVQHQKTNIQRANITFVRFEGKNVSGPGIVVQTDLVQLYKEFEAMGRVGGYVYFDNSDGGRIGFNLSRFDQYAVEVLPPEEKSEPTRKYDAEGKLITDDARATDAEVAAYLGPKAEPDPKV